MEPIPIYDATAPVACTAGAAELDIRMEEIERLRSDLERVDRTQHGLLLQFPSVDDIEAAVRTFTVDEKACCQFWGFDVQRDDEHIRLRWDGPPTVESFFDGLLEYFEGNRPMAELRGLL